MEAGWSDHVPIHIRITGRPAKESRALTSQRTGRPAKPIAPELEQDIRGALGKGRGIQAVATYLGVSRDLVLRVRDEMEAEG